MARGEVERRLAAVLAADVAGYSRLMGADEEGTLAGLKSHITELFEPGIAAHHGRVVKTTGDGLLAEFASVVDAVRCAIEVQRAMAQRNAPVEAAHRIDFRIGINLGDIIVDGGDIYGDGVNVAARLEGIADPGGILVSGGVRDQIEGKVGVALADLGEQSLKNISHRIHVWRIALDGAAIAVHPPHSDKPSIAVLPFANMSGDAEQEYFSDGITEDLITDLSKVSSLLVIARNSVFTYKGKAVNVTQVCRDLGVNHALEGSVRKVGNRVRVTAQLIDAATGVHVWAERYDRDLNDVFAVQDELTREIVGALKVRLTPEEATRVGVRETENIEAYDLVLRAMEYSYRFTREGYIEAKRLLERALEIAPDYARAKAWLAWVLAQAATLQWTDPASTMAAAQRLVDEAVAHDPSLAFAYSVLAHVAIWSRRHEEALTAADRAIALDPNFALSHGLRAQILAYSGRAAEAIVEAETAMRLDPLEGLGVFVTGLSYFIAGRDDEGLAMLQRAAIRKPDFMPARVMLAAALANKGRMDEAKREVDAARTINPVTSIGFLRRTLPYKDPAIIDRLTALLRRAGLPD